MPRGPSLWQRFRQLSLWNKLNVVGVAASVLGVALGILGLVLTHQTVSELIIRWLYDSLHRARHSSVIPTTQATFFWPLVARWGGERFPDFVPSLSVAATSAACCKPMSSSSTTQRTTHFRLRQR